jgi:TonB-linked SusC/RagA family outer membrane protein
VTVTAGRAATLDFRLGRSPIELETVVSTGYATQTKATVTGAAEVVGGAEIQKRPVSNITKGLQGFMPGVVVRDFGGRPGGDGGQIRIRGAGTLGDNAALILVDGVVGEINNLDPLDIESVSVLKDAASAAIYGARAANGVILIKTRRGRNTGNLKVTYDGYAATQKAQDMPKRVDIRTELEAVNQVYVNSGQRPKYTQGYIDSTAAGLDPVNYPNTNWLDMIYKTAPMYDNTVRVSGGNDLAQLSLSGNHFDQRGILTAENYYKRTTLRGNSDFNISRHLTASADLMLMDERVVRPMGEGDAQFRALHDTPPTSIAFYPDGSYGWSKSAFNPVALLREQGRNDSRWRTASLNTRAAYDFKNGLKFSGYFTGDNKDNRGLDFRPAYRFTDRNAPNVARMENVRTVSRDTRNTDYNMEVQATGEYERTFRGHTAHLLAGYDQRRSDHDDVFAERQGAYNNDLQLPGSGDVSFQSTGSNANTARLVGLFSRLNYNWLGRYLFEANVRRDGSSRFGPNKKYGVFPSVSAAWRISDEPFFRDRVGVVTDLKLRGSWGRLGNDRIGNYLYQQTINLNSGNYNFNNALATGATPGRIANPDIGWETTEQADGGVDVELFDGRMSFTGDVYRKNTTGILLAIPISSLVGQAAPTQNAGAVSNVGWESSLNWRDQFRSVRYSVGFNLSDNKNKITSLPGGDQIGGGGTIRRVGEPIDAIFGIRAVGIFRDSAELRAWPTQVPGKTGPGDLKYQDQNGDGKIDGNDRIVIGDPFPHYIWGANMSATYRQFDVSVLLQGVGKQDAYMDGALIEGPTWENFFPEYLRDSWTPQNLDAAFPRFVFRSDHNHNAPGRNSWWVRDARYVALKNLNVGYAFPTSLAHHVGLSSARVYVAGTNVFTWSKMKGLLPAELNPGASRGTYYYQTRNWSFGTSLGL